MPRLKTIKRKFHGNRYTTSSPPSTVSTSSTFSASDGRKSSSSKKIKLDNEVIADSVPGHSIVNLQILFETVTKFAVCKICSSEIRFTEVGGRKGLETKFELLCMNENCLNQETFGNGRYLPCGKSEINSRFVYAQRSVGLGKAGGTTWCATMDLPHPVRNFLPFQKAIGIAVEQVAHESMKSAAQEAIQENEDNPNITAAFDGSWQKRGHTSLNGIMSATSVDTGKVLDVFCMSKYCNICKGDSKHSAPHRCSLNYEGVSGGMETAGAKKIFERSLSDRGVRYVQYLGDGDSKAYQAVANDKPYGNIEVTKLECIGHIQKRMGARLRRLCKDKKGIKLEDGKPIRGKGRLTDSVIDELQSYYGNAIRKNVNNLEAMHKAVWAIYFHRLSTNSNPNHGLCPMGENSWCKFNRSEESRASYTHKHSLPEAVMKAIKPTFRDLSNKTLLRKCLHGRTQNPNESLNNVIWTRLPKRIFVGKSTLEMGVYDAVITFNDGAVGRLKVLQKLGMTCSPNTTEGLRYIDNLRIKESQKIERDIQNGAAKNKKRARKKRIYKKEEEAKEYQAGAF